MVGTWDDSQETFVNRLAFMDKAASALQQARIRPQIGHVALAAPVGESLHVFYHAGGFHHRYTGRSDRRELRLPDGALPLAVAGERAGPLSRLWAVVHTPTADVVAIEWEQHLRERAAQPAEDAPPPGDAVIGVAPDPDRLHLVKYESLYWQPGFAAPDEASGSEHLWLAVATRHHLLWQKHGDDLEIRYAWQGGQGWVEGPPINLEAPLESGFLGINNNQLVFIALTRQQADPQRLRVAGWVSQEAAWVSLPQPLDEQGQPLRLPLTARAVTAFDDDLVIFRTHEGRHESGAWRLMSGGAPVQAFQEVPLRPVAPEPALQQGVQQFLVMVVIAALLGLVLWRRQESLANPLELPEGMAIARPGRRAVAALVDIAPAAIFVALWWAEPLREFYSELQAAREPEDPVILPAQLGWAWFTLTLLYTIYCMCFELFWSRTPGKWLMSCEVLSENLAPPAHLQVVIRNGARLLELERHLWVWPFLLVIFITRNRQRVGDLIARTVVVERLPVVTGTSSEEDSVEAGRRNDRE